MSRWISLELGEGSGFHLDCIQTGSHGDFHFAVAGNLSVISIFSDAFIRRIGKTAYSRERQGFSAVFHKMRGVKLVAEHGECTAAGKLHFENPGLDGFRNGVMGLVGHFPERECTWSGFGKGCDGLVQIVHAAETADH